MGHCSKDTGLIEQSSPEEKRALLIVPYAGPATVSTGLGIVRIQSSVEGGVGWPWQGLLLGWSYRCSVGGSEKGCLGMVKTKC